MISKGTFDHQIFGSFFSPAIWALAHDNYDMDLLYRVAMAILLEGY